MLGRYWIFLFTNTEFCPYAAALMCQPRIQGCFLKTALACHLTHLDFTRFIRNDPTNQVIVAEPLPLLCFIAVRNQHFSCHNGDSKAFRLLAGNSRCRSPYEQQLLTGTCNVFGEERLSL